MFDTMTLTKITGALCGTFLVFLLGKWAADGLYPTHIATHGDDHHQAYTIEVASSEGGEAEPAEEIDVAAVLAAGDVAKGEKVFGKCKSCHKIDGNDGTGPHLNGVMGRGIGDVAGFAYSEVMASHTEDWTGDNMFHFLESPKAWAPGTKMSFAGLKKPEDRADLIAYLASLGG